MLPFDLDVTGCIIIVNIPEGFLQTLTNARGENLDFDVLLANYKRILEDRYSGANISVICDPSSSNETEYHVAQWSTNIAMTRLTMDLHKNGRELFVQALNRTLDRELLHGLDETNNK